MPIPKYDEMYRAFLDCLADGQLHRSKEVKDTVAGVFSVSEKERAEMLPSGKQQLFDNRIGWTRTYLKKAGLVQSPSRGIYVITPAGRQVLNENPPQIDNLYLQRFESFRKFISPNNNEEIALSTPMEKVSGKTPQDVLDEAFQQINTTLADDLLSEVMKQPPAFFEHLVVKLLMQMGYGGSVDNPRLIQKDAEGKFVYKFSFFRRTKRWKYFFGISLDGADAMRILYRYHIGSNKRIPPYLSYFQKLSGHEQHNPVILLYDNESKSERPLKKFLGEDVHATVDQKAELKAKLHMRLITSSKLFVVTPPLIGDKEECEIEDLFSDELLSLNLEGKTFCHKDKFDSNKYFGKEIFSQYVYENYRTIDFSRFIPLLDVIDMIIAQAESHEQ